MYFGSIPFAGYPTFEADTVEQLEHHLATYLRAKVVSVPGDGAPLGVLANRWQLPHGEVWFASSLAPYSVALPDGDFIRVQLCQLGSSTIRGDGIETELTYQQACVSEPSVEISFGRNFRQLIWRVRRDALTRRLVSLTGRPCPADLTFERALPLDNSEGEQLRGMMACLLHILSLPGSLGVERLLADLEAGLIAAFLYASRHGASALLRSETKGGVSWQVRRAEAFIEANCRRHVSIEELVEVTGVSARSLYRTFRQCRGYSPQEFLRQVRLRQADAMLRAPGAVSVTDVALACGFSDLSRFSRDFARAFGAPPSRILRQSRAGVSIA